MDGRDHVRRAIRHYLEKDDDLREDPADQAHLDASIQAAFVLARAAVAAARDIRDMILRLPPYLEGRPSALHRHYDAVWNFLGALWELIDFCELEQDVASSDVEDPVWFFGRALDQHLGGNPFEALALLEEAGLGASTADPWVQMLRAEALAATGEQVDAIKAWEEASSLDPLLVQAHVSVAGELEALGRDREARVHWLAVRKAVPCDEPIAGEAKRHLARLRQRMSAKPQGKRAEPFARLPRWGPSWVPAWPGLGRPLDAIGTEIPNRDTPSAAPGAPRSGSGSPFRQPGAQTTEPGVPSTGPDTPFTRPGAQPAEPSVQSVEPGAQPAEPGVQSVEPGAQPAEPSVQSVEPGAQSAGPGTAPAGGILSRFGLRGPFRTGNLQILLGPTGTRDRDVTVYVAGTGPTSEGVLRSRSAVYLGGARLVGSGTASPEAVEREEPDVVLLASGIGAEHCHALAERAAAGMLHGRFGPTAFVYNGPPDLRGDLGVIFEDLPLEILPDICPPTPDPDLAWDEPASDTETAVETPDGMTATVAAIEKRVRGRLEGRPSPRAITARGAIGLTPALGWLDGGEGRYKGRVPPYDLIAVSSEPEAVETIAVRGGQASGHSFCPGGDDRGRLLEELFDDMPRVLSPGDTALLLARLLGEGGSVSLTDGSEAFVAASLAAGVLSRAMLGLRQTLAAESSYAVRSNHLLVSGSLVSRLPAPEYALLAAVDGCQPTGVTRLLLDPYGIITALGDGLMAGRLAPDDPSLADGAASLLAGSCICVAPLVQGVSWGRPGRKPILAATVKGAWRDGERTWQLFRGEVIWVPLPAGRRVELAVRPASSYNLGRGRGADWHGELVAGGMGLLLDGRGRPLRLPGDEASRTTLRAVWASEILGKAKGA